MSRTDIWTRQSHEWAAWADAAHEDDVIPAFLDLVPRRCARVLDLGCGEGRLARELRHRGHAVSGVDVAPELVELARQRDPDGGDYRVARAEALPFGDGSFGAVVAFNVLMNVDDPAAAVAEAARVLSPYGRLAVSIVHPLASAGRWEGDAFVIPGYLDERAHEDRIQDVVFANLHAPIETWSRWLEEAGFAVETLREVPRAQMRGWNRLPMFLFLRAVKR